MSDNIGKVFDEVPVAQRGGGGAGKWVQRVEAIKADPKLHGKAVAYPIKESNRSLVYALRQRNDDCDFYVRTIDDQLHIVIVFPGGE